MKLWFEFFLNHVTKISYVTDRKHLEIPLKIHIFFIYNYKQTYNFDNLSLLSKNQPIMVKYVKKNLLLQFTNLWLSIFHVKNNVKLLDWISFLKMIPHVSFPNKNLKNFSLSLGVKSKQPGQQRQISPENWQLPKNFSLKSHLNDVVRKKTASWYYYYLNFTYLGSNLVSALTGLNVNDFSHLE